MDPVNESYDEQSIPGISPDAAIIYPTKYLKTEQPANVWYKSIISLALYLVLGYYIFHSFTMLLIITAIVIFHEMGHFIAMKAFRYKDLGIFFIPLLGAYVSGSKREVSQKESAIILLAGPLPGILLGIGFYFLYQYNPYFYISHVSLYDISFLLIFLNIINLLPIYPLDGGQLINRVFFEEEGWVSKIFVLLSVGFLCWFAISKNFYPLLIFPLMMLFRLFGDTKITALEKKLETTGINMDTSYEDLPDEDYWKIRSVVVEHLPQFKDVPPGPPYEYHEKEEKIMTTVQSLLHRHLIQDVSLVGKIFIVLLCVAAFATPWFLQMDILGRFRF